MQPGANATRDRKPCVFVSNELKNFFLFRMYRRMDKIIMSFYLNEDLLEE